MSKKFHKDVVIIRETIRQQCVLYRKNFGEFSDLLAWVKAREQFNPIDIEHCEHFISQMNSGDVKILFCGQVKSGKSRCIMEFLSGSVQLPSKDTPTTVSFTNLFYADPHVLYSEDSGGNKQYYEFNGKVVEEKLVAHRKNCMVDDSKLDLMYYVGIADKLLEHSVVVIDTPGLNESKSLDEAFYRNLRKINPQIVIYIFNCGAGFVDYDCECYSAIVANVRKDLKQIFVFNKFDEEFKLEVLWLDSSESETENKSDHVECSSSDEEVEVDFEEKYKIQYERHKRKLNEIHCKRSCPCLIGYSGRITNLHRCSKSSKLEQFKSKHLELLNHIRCNINSLDLDFLQSALRVTRQFLFSDFQRIFNQILHSDNTNRKQGLLSNDNTDKLLAFYDSSHEKLLNVMITQVSDISLDGTIVQIVNNQDRIQSTCKETKFTNIISSLTKCFIDRYVNYFSNIILAKIEEISFDKLNDDLCGKGIDSLFSHTFCTLTFEIDKIEHVIKSYFDNESTRILSLGNNNDEHIFKTAEACTFYIKNNYKYQKDIVWMTVAEFIKEAVRNERKALEQAIEDKKKSIVNAIKMSKEQTNAMITSSVFLLHKWLTFNNTYILELSTSEFSSKEKREFLTTLINSQFSGNEEIIERARSLNIGIKREEVDISKLSDDNCTLIKYLLRCQYISNEMCPVNYYFINSEHHLYFLTDLQEVQPLRVFLNKDVTEADKMDIISQLIKITGTCYEQCLPIDNFGPDMVFCCRSDDGIMVKIGDSIQHFDEWRYTLWNGELSNVLHHKCPVLTTDKLSCMLYSLCWTILIVLNGRCDNLGSENNITYNNFDTEISGKFAQSSNDRLYKACSNAIKLILQCVLKSDEIAENIVHLEVAIQ